MLFLPKSWKRTTSFRDRGSGNCGTPNAVVGSAMALRFRAGLQPNETVLINGATGVTGRLAVQIAKLYGAKRVIATGRNEESLKNLSSLGADELVPLKDENTFVSQVKNLHQEYGIDVLIDFIWGSAAEWILSALKGRGGFTRSTRFVTVGAMAGDTITLSSPILRGTDIRLCGSGLGSWSRGEVHQLISQILPEMFQLAAKGKLMIQTVHVPLEDIERVWDRKI